MRPASVPLLYTSGTIACAISVATGFAQKISKPANSAEEMLFASRFVV
jgi:hypothetical protein